MKLAPKHPQLWILKDPKWSRSVPRVNYPRTWADYFHGFILRFSSVWPSLNRGRSGWDSRWVLAVWNSGSWSWGPVVPVHGSWQSSRPQRPQLSTAHLTPIDIPFRRSQNCKRSARMPTAFAFKVTLGDRKSVKWRGKFRATAPRDSHAKPELDWHRS